MKYVFSACKNSTIEGPSSAALAKRWLSLLQLDILVTVAAVGFAVASGTVFDKKGWRH
jgi:hypothetical protein